ncbi:MAG: CPBP family intramembrane glutamic endopeptidase [Promethearchaeota archaeon]|jgi:membrane protease YdiL (CAAX protease family)
MQGKKRIAKVRFTFFIYEVALVFVFIFLLLIIPVFLVPLIVEEGSILYGILFYLMRAIMVFIGIPLLIYLTNLIFESQKRKVIITEDISPSKGHLKMFKMTKNNYKYQILYGILIFLLLFLPMDFFTYLFVPKMIEYQAFALGLKSTNSYLLTSNYFIFLISVIVIQISVGVTEETIARGFLAKRGSEYYFKMSAVMISSLYWAFGHFAYFLDPVSRFYPVWFPLVWFIQALIIGLVLALFVLRKKWILPVIIAHTLNNIISAHTVWGFWQGNAFQVVTLYLYIPLLIIGVVFLIWNRSKIKDGISSGFKEFKTYFRSDSKEESKGYTLFRVLFDILMGIIIFVMGLLVAI